MRSASTFIRFEGERDGPGARRSAGGVGAEGTIKGGWVQSGREGGAAQIQDDSISGREAAAGSRHQPAAPARSQIIEIGRKTVATESECSAWAGSHSAHIAQLHADGLGMLGEGSCTIK